MADAAGKVTRRPEQQRDTRMRFEQWAKNPKCEANTLSAVHNVKMAKVAESIELPTTFGASPFALGRGEQFEFNLLRNDAERLIPELISTGVLPDDASGLVDLRIRMNRGSDPHLRDLDTACERTSALLQEIGRARGEAIDALDSVIAAATLKLPKGVMLPEALLIIDVLAVRRKGDRAEIVIGEVKTYPDRGGFTDTKQLAQARAQMGLYLHALRTVTAALPKDEQPVFADHGFLVLSRPGSDFPRVRAGEDLRYQAARAAGGFELLEAAAQRLPKEPDPARADDATRLKVVLDAGKQYSESCLSFCDLASKCHADAVDHSDAIILGEDVRRFLSGVSLNRAGELLEGATPADETETELMNRIRAAEEPGWE